MKAMAGYNIVIVWRIKKLNSFLPLLNIDGKSTYLPISYIQALKLVQDLLTVIFFIEASNLLLPSICSVFCRHINLRISSGLRFHAQPVTEGVTTSSRWIIENDSLRGAWTTPFQGKELQLT